MLTPYYNVFTGKTSFPVPFNLLGTITTIGTTVSLSNGNNKLLVGDYIYDITQNEVRKVVSFLGNNPIIELAFTANIISPIQLQITTRKIYLSAAIICNGVADGQLNNAILKKRTIVNYTNSEGITPFTINGTGTQIAISAL